MNPLIELNRSAYYYHTTCFPTVMEICHPLSDLGIKFFCYIKLFSDGSYLHLATDAELVKTYSETINAYGASSALQMQKAPINQSHHFICPSDIILFDKKKDAMVHLVYDYNIWPIYAIYKNRLEYIEIYCFGLDRLQACSYQFYLQNAPLLDHFCLYFNDRAGDIIDASDRKKRAFFPQQFHFKKTSDEDEWRHQAEQFLLETELRRLTLQGKTREMALSQRETECVFHLAQGKSAKEIARNLSLSPRTVEFYLQNARKKSGLNKEQTLTCFLDHSGFNYEGLKI